MSDKVATESSLIVIISLGYAFMPGDKTEGEYVWVSSCLETRFCELGASIG